MLLQLFRALEHECGAEGVGSGPWPAADAQLGSESVAWDGGQVSEHQLETRRGRTARAAQSSDLALRESKHPDCTQPASAPVPHCTAPNARTHGAGSAGTHELRALCECAHGIHESLAVCRHCTAVTSDSAGPATPCEHLGVGEGLEEAGCGVARGCSSSIVEAGSVLPVGGYFEILLHYYIQRYAAQVQQPAIKVVSNIVADALLSIPKALYGRNGFTKFYLETMEALRKNQPLPVSEEGLESVYCKYQLVTAVLHCAAELLNIDLIIGVKRPPRKIEDNDSDDDI
ncbi:hypothetical protein ASZ78_012858 [Callipepla squamata]|uniref:Uncharacterized protein n=1 Tax=Callipepla squamata TaxID=9009 RepID=A0A226NNX7_CALSU|nr:hypothetical protein ASZ78_012858 [Callipepla squamata]